MSGFDSRVRIWQALEDVGSLVDVVGGYASVQTGTPTNGTGQVGGGIEFNGTTQYYKITSGGDALGSANGHRIRFWMNCADFSTAPVVLTCNGSVEFFFEVDATHIYWGYRGPGNPTHFKTYTVTIGSGWHKVDLIGATGDLYLDGVLQTSFTGVHDSGAFGAADLWVGVYATGPVLFFDGILDDLSIDSGVGRTQDWITTEFNNESAPGSFFAFGSETAIGGSAIVLEASVASAATAAGALTTQIVLAGSAASAASCVGAFTTAIALTASLLGSATASGALTTQIPLAGSVSGAGTCAGDLATAIRLAASVTGQASASGALSTSITLAASLAAAASVSGAIAGDTALLGSLTGTGSCAGDLSTQVRLVSSVTGAASTAGQLTTAIALAGAGSGAAQASASLNTVVVTATGDRFQVPAAVRRYIVPASVRRFVIPERRRS
jgi:hypothetical protein